MGPRDAAQHYHRSFGHYHMARLLVLDDDPLTLETWTWMLRDAGHEVDTAPSGAAAEDVLRSQRYDVILADLYLGDITAIDLLDRMRDAGRAMPLIVVTGLASIETAVAAMRHGAINYALKPLIGDELLQQIELALRHTAARTSEPAPHDHAARRWAEAVAGVLSARQDPRTVGQWARAVGASSSTLRTWCLMAELSPKRSLTLARMLRAVHQSRDTTWQPAKRLDVTDPRTLRRMLDGAGLPSTLRTVSVKQLLATQSFIDNPDALDALKRALADAYPAIELT
jgi:DNA-binding response OmpR family regulator